MKVYSSDSTRRRTTTQQMAFFEQSNEFSFMGRTRINPFQNLQVSNKSFYGSVMSYSINVKDDIEVIGNFRPNQLWVFQAKTASHRHNLQCDSETLTQNVLVQLLSTKFFQSLLHFPLKHFDLII